MGKVLQVKHLKISFRTPGGTLKAVRDISFSLERGETLAIVGESGSGKSVTSKAILGILAGNAIIEGGEILYDDKDLLKISEEDMCNIRGDKIAMIFQDPLSSLNPIVKIGKQITEAMLLKNKVSRKEARRDFNAYLGRLKDAMIQAHPQKEAEIQGLIQKFDSFNIQAIQLENRYNLAASAAQDLESAMDDFTFRVEKHVKFDRKGELKGFASLLKRVKDPFLTADCDAQIQKYLDALPAAAAAVGKDKDASLPENVSELIAQMQAQIGQLRAKVRPDFFSLGFYALENPAEDLSQLPVEQANEKAKAYLESRFLEPFFQLASDGVRQSFVQALEHKKKAVTALQEAKPYFAAGAYDRKEVFQRAKTLCGMVDLSIDRLDFVKDSTATTFSSTLHNYLEKYFYYQEHNPKEEARFAKQNAKREALIAKGKHVDWKVVPKTVYPLTDFQDGIVAAIEYLCAHYERLIAEAAEVDFAAKTEALIGYFKAKASQVVYRETQRMAKEKALKLMEEVGIPEPRMRYYQYPFEFSGGMRQRIVIAIALSANPDILICDEPTTALDVTIQAQILELINKLKRDRGVSVIFITHDLGVVANMADKIAVMYAGKIVEYGTADDVFYDPRHPYTWALLSSMPDLDTSEKLDAIPGTPPNMIYPPKGDAFAARNKYALKIDYEEQPPMFPVSDTHFAATWLLHPEAPQVEVPKIITDRIQRMKERDNEAKEKNDG